MMNKPKNLRKDIISQPSYWIEKINAELYEAIMDFMETHGMKQKDLAAYLDISSGRMSQIINEGDINFSLEKIIQIALKLGKLPSFELVDRDDFLLKEKDQKAGEIRTPTVFESKENYGKE